MEEPTKAASPLKKRLILILKIFITLLCLWYVSTKIDFRVAAMAMARSNWIWLAAALILYIISKVVSAYRLNINFRNIGIHISENENTRLYWLGMFYNLFLPGSISGDAYKVVILSKRLNKPYKKTTAAVLLDRFSGLAGLGLILSVYGMITLRQDSWKFILVAGSLLAVALLYFFIKKWLPGFLPGFGSTLTLGVIVQIIQVIAVYCIMLSLDIPVGIHAYLLLFLVSSAASVLPLTIGGLGLREIVFLEGSAYFGLHQETAILISLLFFFITVIASALGLLFVFKDPFSKELLKKNAGSIK